MNYMPVAEVLMKQRLRRAIAKEQTCFRRVREQWVHVIHCIGCSGAYG